jgi:hypothetical protein
MKESISREPEDRSLQSLIKQLATDFFALYLGMDPDDGMPENLRQSVSRRGLQNVSIF